MCYIDQPNIKFGGGGSGMCRGLLGLYWKAREQSLDDCTDLCLRTLITLRENGFDGFYLPGRSRKDSLRRTIDLSKEGVRKILLRNRNRRDDNREVITELGFSLYLWSPRGDEEAFGLSLHCGCYSQWVGNNVTMTFPGEGPNSFANVRESAERLFDALVMLWKPELGILTEAEIRWQNGVIPNDVPAYKRYP